MSLALGKRKRRQDVSRKYQNVNKDDGSDDDDATARALFQRAFEKKFKPLPKTEKPANQDDTPGSEDDDVDDDDDEDDDQETIYTQDTSKKSDLFEVHMKKVTKSDGSLTIVCNYCSKEFR